MSAALLANCADAAVAYHGLGWNVIPISREKVPCCKWGPWQNQRQPLDFVARIFADHPDANVAVLTGAASRIVVLEVDGDDGRASLAALGAPPDWTPRVRSRRGHHYYFRHPGYVAPSWAHSEKVATTPAHLRGLDFRGDPGLVVAPPSVHRSGFVYAWEVAPDGL